jgi:hypothetical protein
MGTSAALRRGCGHVAQGIQRETATRGAERYMVMRGDIANAEFRKHRIDLLYLLF